MFKPIESLVVSIFSAEISQPILTIIGLLIFGLFGIVMMIKKEAPIIIITIQGLLAVIIGLIIVTISFGGIIWGILRTFLR